MTSLAEFLASALIGGFGLCVSLGYVVVHFRLKDVVRSPYQDLETPAGWQQRIHRRLLGMAILAVVSVGLFLGVNLIDSVAYPLQFACYWLIILLMVLWLLALALADIRHTLTLHRRWTLHRVQKSERQIEELQSRTAPHAPGELQ